MTLNYTKEQAERTLSRYWGEDWLALHAEVERLTAEREACWNAVRAVSWITHDDLPLAITQAFIAVREDERTQAMPEVQAMIAVASDAQREAVSVLVEAAKRSEQAESALAAANTLGARLAEGLEADTRGGACASAEQMELRIAARAQGWLAKT